jgi:hypothetical protein
MNRMPTKQLDHQCWILEYPTGAPEDYRHFPSEAEARETVDDKYTESVNAWRLAAPCHIAICDAPGCGEALQNEDEGWTVHLASPADLGPAAIANGWTITADGDVACYDEPASAVATP